MKKVTSRGDENLLFSSFGSCFNLFLGAAILYIQNTPTKQKSQNKYCSGSHFFGKK
jgi:hypothetical protein